MENKFNINTKTILGVALGLLVMGASFVPVGAYGPKETHYPLGKKAVELYNQHHPDSALSEQEKEWVAKGAHDEDVPACRVVHHFYDPVNNTGLDTFESSKKWVHDNAMQALGRFQTRCPGDFRENPGVHTWEEAINAYKNGDKKTAYHNLGHIFHLIQDATVPAHTRQDPHPELNVGDIDIEFYGGSDPYEQGVKDFNVPSIAEMEPRIYGNLNTYFDRVASFTNRNFLSKDSLGMYDNPHLIRMDANYVYGDINGAEVRLVKIFGGAIFNYKNLTDANQIALDDPQVLRDYWNHLSREAIENTAGILRLFHEEAKKAIEKEKEKKQAEEEAGFWGGVKNGIKSGFNKTKEFASDTWSGVTARARSTKEFVGYTWERHMYNPLSLSADPELAVGPSSNPPFVTPTVNLNLDLDTYQEERESKASEKFARQLQGPADKLQNEFQNFLDQNEDNQSNQEDNPSANEVSDDETPDEQSSDEQSPDSQTAEENEQQQQNLYTVKSVIDGDTIKLENGETVRYIGVNAPEKPNGCFAEDSSAHNRSLVQGEEVRLEKGKEDKDEHGRLLRFVWVGDVFVNKELIETGNVYAFDYGSNHKYNTFFESLEDNAEKERRGLWGDVCHPNTSSGTDKESSKKENNEKEDDNKNPSHGPNAPYGPIGPGDVNPDQKERSNFGNQDNKKDNESALDHLIINEIQVQDKEFVELYNPTGSDVSLDNYYFSYYSSSRTQWNNPWRNKNFPSSAVIPSNSHYLIGLNGYSEPEVDWSVYSSKQLSNSTGTVAIFSEKVSTSTKPVDAVAWCKRNKDDICDSEDQIKLKETKTAETPKEDKSISRTNHKDTDNNRDDFSKIDPTPKNSLEPVSLGSPIWASYQNDPRNSGSTNLAGPGSSSKWQYPLGTRPFMQPIIDAEGNLYITEGNHLLSLNSSGSKRWRVSLTGFPNKNFARAQQRGAALSNDSSRVYVVNCTEKKIKFKNNDLRCYLETRSTADGSVINRSSVSGKINNGAPTTPVVHPDTGKVYVLTNRRVFEFNKNGSLSNKTDWKFIDWESISDTFKEGRSYVCGVSSPAIFDDKLLTQIDPSCGISSKLKNRIIAVDIPNLASSNEPLGWQRKILGGQRGVVVSSSGKIFGPGVYDAKQKGKIITRSFFSGVDVSVQDGTAYSGLRSDTPTLRRTEVVKLIQNISPFHFTYFSGKNKSGVSTNLIVDKNSTAYFGTDSGDIYSITKTGQLNFKKKLGSRIYYITVGDNVLYSVVQDEQGDYYIHSIQ